MNIKLLLQALIKYIFGLIMVGILLFLPAGTINYWNGWLLIGLLFIPMLVLGLILFIKDKELLKKRLNSKEKEPYQKKLIAISLIIFIIGFVLAALDFRYHWSNMSPYLVSFASIVLLIAYAIYGQVMRENEYLSRIVEIQKEQKVIDTGLYAIVRHPMYFAITILFLSFPIVLGSWISFIIFCSFPFVLVKRIKNEEDILENGLEGYKEYKQKVKYKMIPFIW